MNPSNDIQPSAPTEPQVVSNRKKKIITTLYILSIIIFLCLGYVWTMNCAWGGCPNALSPIPWFGVVMLVLLLLRLAFKIILISSLYWSLFTLSVSVMLGLIVIDILPAGVRNNYVYGRTLAACETGKPSVPWGNIPADKNDCYNSIGECLKMSKYSNSCFYSVSSKTKLVNINQCEGYIEGKDQCLYDIAVNTQNIDICRTVNIIDSEGVSQEVIRYSCAEEVSGINEIIPESNGLARKDFRELLYPYAHNKAVQESAEGTREYRVNEVKYGIEFCNNNYTSDRKDVCLYQVVVRAEHRIEARQACDQISLDWFKTSCIKFEESSGE